MWCRSCRQDVPGLADGLDGRLACPRCSAVLLSDAGLDLTQDLHAARSSPSERLETPSAYSADEADPYGTPVFEPVRSATPEPSRVTTLRWDAANWELNEKLRHVERVTASTRLRFDSPTAANQAAPYSSPTPAPWPSAGATMYPMPSAPPPSYASPPYAVPRAPTAYAAPQHPSGPFAPPPYPPPPPAPQPNHYEWNGNPEDHWDTPSEIIASLTMWLFMGAAVVAFSCGGFLAAWGGIAERPHLQNMAMPVIIVGVGLLVIGLLPRIFLKQVEEEDRKRLRATQQAASPHYRGVHQHERSAA
jgi:hypothetical protein